jgi:hypothetical protein
MIFILSYHFEIHRLLCIIAYMWSYWSYRDAMLTDLHLFNRSFVMTDALLTDILLYGVLLVRIQIYISYK